MASSAVFRSLRHRNARLYFLGLVVSNVGTWLQGTAQAWLVLRLTDSGTALGVVTAIQFLPMLLLGAWSGALADRVNRRRLLFVTQSLLAVQAIALGIADLAGWVTVGLVYALTLALGVINALDTPARRSFISELVAAEELSNAMSINTAVMTGSRIFGPALAGLLISQVGTGWCFIVNGVSFAALLLALVFMDTSKIHRAPAAPRAKGQVREGLRYVNHEPVLRLTMWVLLIVSTFTFNYQVTLPLLVERVFHGGSAAFGAILAITSVGSLLGSFVAAARPDATLRFMAVSLGVLGAFAAAVALSPSFASALVLGVPMGAGGAAFIACSSGILVARTKPEMRGRVLALQSIAFLGSTPIGGPLVGWVGERFGARWGLLIGAVVALAVLVWMLRPMRRLDTVAPPLGDTSTSPATAG